MGSKQAILPFLYRHLADRDFSSALDGFSGSGSVSYLLKAMGKSVASNDFLRFAFHTSNAIVANSDQTLSSDDLYALLQRGTSAGTFVQDTFRGLYFSDDENAWLDNITTNIPTLSNASKESIAYAALAHACLRRRPRGLFTYTGVRYDDGRKDLRTSLEEHFLTAVNLYNEAVFSTDKLCSAHNADIFKLKLVGTPDLVYLDPPYVSSLSDNDYIRRYHFVEGLVRRWQGVKIQTETKTKKFKRYASAFDSKRTIHDAFSTLFELYRDSIIVVSYSSNSIPTKTELTDILKATKKSVNVYSEDHLYSFGTHAHKVGSNQNRVEEYLFIGE